MWLDMISDNLYSQIQEDLVSCDRMQMLTLAAFGLERLWRMFEDWTKTEGDPLLYQKPNSFRQRMRDILDHIWEQIESGQEINPYEKEFNDFCNFVNASFDENDGQDVDMGTGTPLIDEMFSGVVCFFSEREARSYASSCIVSYAGYLLELLYDRFYDECKKSVSGQEISPGERAELLDAKIDAAIAEHPLWKEEIERIKHDFAIVKKESNHFKSLCERKVEIQRMNYITEADLT